MGLAKRPHYKASRRICVAGMVTAQESDTHGKCANKPQLQSEFQLVSWLPGISTKDTWKEKTLD